VNNDKIIKEVADWIINNNGTVRAAADKGQVNYSKTWVHKMMSFRLREIDINRYIAVQEVFIKNKRERHIRGGKSTSIKYLKRSIKDDM